MRYLSLCILFTVFACSKAGFKKEFSAQGQDAELKIQDAVSPENSEFSDDPLDGPLRWEETEVAATQEILFSEEAYLADQTGITPGIAAPFVLASFADSAEKVAREAQVRSLKENTPLNFDVDSLWRDVGYTSFPALVFTPKSGSSPSAHRFLIGTGQQVYQQALLAVETGNFEYASNAAKILRKVVEVDLNFTSDPARPDDLNDNRYLTAAWFIASLARGATILGKATPESWRQKEDWTRLRSKVNLWIDATTRTQSDPRIVSLLQLISHKGTMTWVSHEDHFVGSTNRTFALLEAQMRVADLRRGSISPQRSMTAVFAEFRTYLKNYFTTVDLCLGDPLIPGSQGLNCLRNKDEPRRDTFHPLMGMASIVHILEIGSRYGMILPEEERLLVIKGLRWGSDNNTARPGGFTAQQVVSDIDLYESSYRLFSDANLGLLVARDRDIIRNRPHKAGLAWGYSLIAGGLY